MISIVSLLFGLLVLAWLLSKKRTSDSNLVVLLAACIIAWSVFDLLAIYQPSVHLKERFADLSKLAVGAAAGVFLSLTINGGWKRFRGR